eukprot:6732081-Prorocentrum_lima.AAC.1
MTWWQRRSLEEAKRQLVPMGMTEEWLGKIDERLKEMRRQEQESKPLGIRQQQLAEAIKTKQSQL